MRFLLHPNYAWSFYVTFIQCTCDSFPNQNLIKCGEVSLIQSLIFFMVVLYLLEFEAVSHVIEVSASMKCSLDYKTLIVILVTKKIPLSASLSPTGKISVIIILF